MNAKVLLAKTTEPVWTKLAYTHVNARSASPVTTAVNPIFDLLFTVSQVRIMFLENDDPCSSAPCRNGAECEKRENSNTTLYRCLCNVGWSGRNCDKEVCEFVFFNMRNCVGVISGVCQSFMRRAFRTNKPEGPWHLLLRKKARL